MAYILYIPNPECGPTAYTQRSFETLKDLARWSMEHALDSAAAPVPALVSHDASTTQQQSTPLEQLDAAILVSDVAEDKKLICYYINPLCLGCKVNAKTSTLDNLIIARDWGSVAMHYSDNMPFSKGLYGGTNVRNLILTEDEVIFIAKLVYRHSVLVSPDYLWRYNTNRFPPCVEEKLLSRVKIGTPVVLQDTNPKLVDALTIYRVFRDYDYHHSWTWVHATAVKKPAIYQILSNITSDTLVSFCLSWVRDEESNELTRKTILAYYTLQEYAYRSGATSCSVGSDQYLTSYLRNSSLEDISHGSLILYSSLPIDFRKWAAQGLTHSTCTSILENMGVSKVRRSEGQRYMSISEVAESDYNLTNYCSLQYSQWRKSNETTVPYEECDSLSNYLCPLNAE
jgi:hypothetical protein